MAIREREMQIEMEEAKQVRAARTPGARGLPPLHARALAPGRDVRSAGSEARGLQRCMTAGTAAVMRCAWPCSPAAPRLVYGAKFDTTVTPCWLVDNAREGI